MASKNRKKLKENPPPEYGVCALLGVDGKYAKSHIIPRALTEPVIKGERFIESGRGTRPIRRFSSWYDTQLVITEGEEILSKIDTAGISELRKHKLVWSGWGGKKKLKYSDYDIHPDPSIGVGFRRVSVDSRKIRLFFLSILWRSLKTGIKEFSYLPRDLVDLDALRDMIVNNDSSHYTYLPVMLDQISTIGASHNYSPTLQDEEVERVGGNIRLRFFRLYMQGIVAHIHIDADQEFLNGMGPMIVGAEEELVVIARKFEASWQYQAAKHEYHNVSTNWPRIL
ncbi:hypothetical protein PSCICL_50580 [Pseudomonas cichorii]|nr:hypothetical protein PSCICL_50580 [Pseudomonas cichorii]